MHFTCISSACLYRRHAAVNGAKHEIISGHGGGRQTSGRARGGKHEAASVGDFPPHGKPAVVIADILAPLAEHHQTIKI
jgi:hypothetical protein